MHPEKSQVLAACDPGFSGALQRLWNGKNGVALSFEELGGAASTIGEARGEAEPHLRK